MTTVCVRSGSVCSIRQCVFHQTVCVPSGSVCSIRQCVFHQTVCVPSDSVCSIRQCVFHQAVHKQADVHHEGDRNPEQQKKDEHGTFSFPPESSSCVPLKTLDTA